MKYAPEKKQKKTNLNLLNTASFFFLTAPSRQ